MSTLSLDSLQAVLEGVGVAGPIPPFPLADVQNSPVDIYISYIAETLVQLTGCEPSIAYESTQWANDLGDLVVVLPRLRLPGVDPKVFSDDLQHNFPESPLFAAPFSDGSNLRFFFDSQTLAGLVLPYIIDRGPAYGRHGDGMGFETEASVEGRKKIVVEFSSPNLGQEFDGNHLRSTIIGAYIASIYESMGWNVYRMNFLGDWGKNIGLLAAGWFRFGSDELFDADPLRHLLDIYAKVWTLAKAEQETAKSDNFEQRDTPISGERDSFFKRMEDGDPDAVALWQRFRRVCVEKYAEMYARLNINFDEYSGESTVKHETTVEVETALKKAGIEEEGDEAWIINFKSHGHKGLGRPVARHRNGTTSYLLRDIAAALERSRDHSFDKMIYVVSAKQDSHFQQVFKALELMGQTDLAGRLQHVSFGKSQGLLPKPGASGILLDDILDDCQGAVLEFLQTHSEDFPELELGNPDASKVADSMGSLTLMAEELSIKRASTFTFEAARMATYDGYTGLTLQYWLDRVRLKTVGVTLDRDRLVKADFSMFLKEAYGPWVDVLRLLVQFPGIVKSSFRALESSITLGYLFRLVDLLPAVFDLDETQEDEDEDEQVDYAEEIAEEHTPERPRVEDDPVQATNYGGEVQVEVDGDDNEPPDGPVHDSPQNESDGGTVEHDAQDQEEKAEDIHHDEHIEEEREAEDTAQDEHIGQGLQGLLIDEEAQVNQYQSPNDAEEQDRHDEDEAEEQTLSPTAQDKGKQRAPDEEPEVPPKELLKVAFFQCVCHVLENGMQVVGMVPVRM